MTRFVSASLVAFSLFTAGWRVGFAPPAPGRWSYRSSTRDPGLDGRMGRFRCTAWTETEHASILKAILGDAT